MGTVETVRSLFYFVLAGMCEIGGGYLVWLWLREGKPLWYALVGAVGLVLYGIIPTFQPASSFRSCLRSLRGHLYHPVHPLGLAGRQNNA